MLLVRQETRGPALKSENTTTSCFSTSVLKKSLAQGPRLGSRHRSGRDGFLLRLAFALRSWDCLHTRDCYHAFDPVGLLPAETMPVVVVFPQVIAMNAKKHDIRLGVG